MYNILVHKKCRHSQTLTTVEETARANRSQASEKKSGLMWDIGRKLGVGREGGSGAWRKKGITK